MTTLLRRTIFIVAVMLAGSRLQAQQPASPSQAKLDSLAAVIRSLQARIEALEGARKQGDTTVVDELAALRAAASAATADSSQQAGPQQARLGANAMNPEISATGDIRAHLFQPGPQKDNFVAREFELGFQSALDPFSTAKIFLSIEGGTVSLEEGYAYFTSLPGALRLDVGQFRQQVGELNRWHLHALGEDEYPLVLRRFAGDEGLKAPGASLYWPLPFSGPHGTYELTVQATSSDNEVLFAGGRRPSVNAQVAGFWQFSRSTFAQVSASALYGTNPDTSLTTKLGVAAARFTWRPPQQGQAREFTIRSELWALQRKFDLSGSDLFNKTRYGGYVATDMKLNRRWVFSTRGDYVQSPNPGTFAHEWAVTPALTFWQSEFVFLRGQYEHSRDVLRTSHDRLTMQIVFAMGPHKHELF
jgi:hypothetical protein